MNSVTETTIMDQSLRTALEEKGWNPNFIGVWGRRVSGDPSGVEIERGGKTVYYDGPFSCIRAGDQIAIVRFG